MYREFQFSTLPMVALAATEILLTYLFINDVGSKPMGTAGYSLVTGLNLVIMLLFYGMTTHIDHNKLVVKFGLGLIKRTVALESVESVEIVKSPWYYGWGLRYIPNGRMYNVSGSSCVALKLKPGRVVWIGTRLPETLHAALMSTVRDLNHH